MSVYPFSPTVIEKFSNHLNDYDYSKGVIRFTENQVVSKDVLALLVEARREQIDGE